MNIYSILGSAITVLSFVTFLGIVAWAYSSAPPRRLRRGGERPVRAA